MKQLIHPSVHYPVFKRHIRDGDTQLLLGRYYMKTTFLALKQSTHPLLPTLESSHTEFHGLILHFKIVRSRTFPHTGRLSNFLRNSRIQTWLNACISSRQFGVELWGTPAGRGEFTFHDLWARQGPICDLHDASNHNNGLLWFGDICFLSPFNNHEIIFYLQVVAVLIEPFRRPAAGIPVFSRI